MPLITLVKLTLARGLKVSFYSFSIDYPTSNITQDDECFSDNDFDSYDLLASRVLDIHQASLTLQSFQNSRHLDITFDLLMEFVKSVFYFCFYIFSLLIMNLLKEA